MTGIELTVLLKNFGPWIFAAGTAYMSVKAGLNGTKARVERIESSLSKHLAEDAAAHAQITQQMARVETKVDLLLQDKVLK